MQSLPPIINIKIIKKVFVYIFRLSLWNLECTLPLQHNSSWTSLISMLSSRMGLDVNAFDSIVSPSPSFMENYQSSVSLSRPIVGFWFFLSCRKCLLSAYYLLDTVLIVMDAKWHNFLLWNKLCPPKTHVENINPPWMWPYLKIEALQR